MVQSDHSETGAKVKRMNQKFGDTPARCTRGCSDWSGELREAEIAETENSNGVNWKCPNCGKLVGTENY